MKNLFFEAGKKEQFYPYGQSFIQTSNNLDSKKYILQRIPISIFSQSQNYIPNHFYLSRHHHLISYITCWKEIQSILIEKPSNKQKQKKQKKQKKTAAIDLLTKKKSKIQTQNFIAPSKKKIFEQSQAERVNQQFVYVQMQCFSQFEIPQGFSAIRDFFAIIYLLGRKVQKQAGVLPCLIPVKNEEESNKIKFFKKGQSLQTELHSLMVYLFKEKRELYLREWSESLQKSILKATIDKDENLIGSLLKIAIEDYIQMPHSICLMKEEQKVYTIETAKIVNYDTLRLQQSEIELPLCEYEIEYLERSEADTSIVMVHEIFDPYQLTGKKNSFIVKWLSQMA